jgi:uncharacterized protein (TIGR02594 family)
MPYVPGAGAHGVIHVADVYNSKNVYINNVPVALWLSPGATGVLSMPAPNPIEISPEQQQEIASSAAAATTPEEAEVGLSGVGDVPPNLATDVPLPSEAEAAVGTTATTTATTATGDIFIDLAKTIDTCLVEAKQGLWKENGSNVRIVGCYSAVGFNIQTDTTPWCAAFAGNILKKVTAPAIRTLSSLAYKNYGTPVPLNDKSKWRLNDVVVFSRAGGGHIGFFRGYNKANGSVLIAGGNQSDSLTEVGFKSSGMPIVYVGRAWSVPNEYDREVTYSGSGGSVKVV